MPVSVDTEVPELFGKLKIQLKRNPDLIIIDLPAYKMGLELVI